MPGLLRLGTICAIDFTLFECRITFFFHHAAGPQLLEAVRPLGGCPTGEAKITDGFRLPATYVIHTVGPVWQGGQQGEEAGLASAYRRSLEVAAENQVRTIAFPSISTGAYGFPFEKATSIALREITRFLEANDLPKEVTLVAFGEVDYLLMKKLCNCLGCLQIT